MNTKQMRNEVVRLIRLSKKQNYACLIDDSQQKPGNVWKIFKDFGAGKRSSNNSNISSLTKNGRFIDNAEEIANEFNDFFIQIAENIKEPIVPTDHEKLSDYCANKIAADFSYQTPSLDAQKVLKYLQNLDITKATGTDDIGPRLLRISAPFISDSITYVCNLSIKSSVFHAKWKEAKVKPLHTTGATDDVNNYRPISILPVLSKLFEKHAHDSLMNYVESYKLLYSTQSGFRPNHSCESALVNMNEKWLQALDKGDLISVVLVDFRKAFDLVDHEILLKKLEIYKLGKSTLDWFKTMFHRIIIQ